MLAGGSPDEFVEICAAQRIAPGEDDMGARAPQSPKILEHRAHLGGAELTRLGLAHRLCPAVRAGQRTCSGELEQHQKGPGAERKPYPA
jgi:hypothetical protein